jgi:sec-independent protein translocase protein TatB
MFDVAWSELMVIGAVALVVIGPKDLPKALRTVGEAVGKVRRMASEFQGQFNDAMREAELHDLKKQVEDVGGSVKAATNVDFNPIQTIRDEIKGATAPLSPGGEAMAAADAKVDAAHMAATEAKLNAIPMPDAVPAPVIPAADIHVAEAPAKAPRKRKAKADVTDGNAA